MDISDKCALLEVAVAASDSEKVRNTLAILHQDVKDGYRYTDQLVQTLERLYQSSTDPLVSAEIKRLQNRIRSKKLLGNDLLRLTSPPLGDSEQTTLWHDLQALQETYEAEHGSQSFSQKFDIYERIGEGGMAIVFRCMRIKDGVPVAIKFLRKEFFQSEAVTKRFKRECEITRSFNHPSIIQVYEAGEYMGGGYLVMDYFPLKGVDNILRDESFSPGLAVTVAIQAAEALVEIHRRGVVHRDVKLSNLLLSEYEPSQNKIEIKLCDFGICKPPRSEGLTTTGTILETEFYSSPEQRERPADVDHRADIFSFGVALYRMLTKKYYPQGSFPLVKELIPGIPGSLDAIVQKCLEYDPPARPDSMATVLQELQIAKKEISV